MLIYRGKSIGEWRRLILRVNPYQELESKANDPVDLNSERSGASIQMITDEENPLVWLVEHDRAQLPLFVALLTDSEWWVRHYAAGMLQKFGREATVAIPQLILLLSAHENMFNKRQAADTLGDIGPDAKAAVPALTALLSDDEVKEWAELALSKIHTAAT